MSRFVTNTNGYIGKSEKFTSIETEEISGPSGSQLPLLIGANKSVIRAISDSVTLTLAESGSTYVIADNSTAAVWTLPAASADTIGVSYKFYMNVTNMTANVTIVSATGTFTGVIVDSAGANNETGATITIANATTVIGDHFEVVGLTASLWALSGVITTDGSITAA